MVQTIDALTGIQIGNILLISEFYKQLTGRLIPYDKFKEIINCYYPEKMLSNDEKKNE